MINDVINETKAKMKASIHHYEEELHGIRGGRASTSLVDRLIVNYYDQDTELRQLASISTPEPMQILIRPYDKGALKGIEKAIRESDLNLNPNTDSDVIRLNMPPLTRERRQDLVKFLHKRMEEARIAIMEEARIAIRNIRRSANDDLKDFEKEGMISEDELERGESEVQKLTDQHIGQIDELGKAKETEIMTI